jgi:DNA transformation protein
MSKKDDHKEFIDYVQDLLKEFGIINIRPMFGGFGVYKNGIIFALIDDNELYFKADEAAAKLFQRYGSTQFTYENNGKQIGMCYWKVVPEVLDDQEMAKKWADISYHVAINSSKKTKKS